MPYKHVTFSNVGKIADKAGNIYQDKIKKRIDSSLDVLGNILIEFVRNYEVDYSLVRVNDSSKEIRLYEMSSRSKSRDSLVEKIVRKQEFYDLDITDEKRIEDLLIEKNDDLMGLRFLVSLSSDCVKMYNVFLDHSDELKDKDIIFLNLTDNPQKMTNRRMIYRLKGKYNKLPFELQIKSKVDSAWADIEHMLFYKDYQFSYIKSTNEGVMNKIGELLDRVDELMIQIRESQDAYEEEKEMLEFVSRLDSRYRDFVKKTIISMSILKDCRSILWEIFHTFGTPERVFINMQMDQKESEMGLKSIKVESNIESSYFIQNCNTLKEKGIELVLIEHIYADWVHGIRKNTKEDEVFNECDIKKFYMKLIEFIVISKLSFLLEPRMTALLEPRMTKDELNNFAKYVATMTEKLMSTKLLNITKRCFIFDEHKLYMLFCFWIAVNSIQGEYEENEDDMLREEVGNVMLVFFLNEDEEECVTKLRDLSEKNDESVISEILSSSFINKLNDEYRKLKHTRSGKKLKDDIIKQIIEKTVGSMED